MVKINRLWGKPIITSTDLPGYGAIFNAGCIRIGDTFYLFARGAKEGYSRKGRGYENYYSDVLLFKSRDGEKYEFVKVLIQGGPGTEHPYGVEDPRIQLVHSNYVLTYSDLVKPAFSPDNSRIGIAVLGFENGEFFVKRKSRICSFSNKNAVVVGLEGNRVALIHRILPNINIAFFDSLEELLASSEAYWNKEIQNPQVLLCPTGDEQKIGAGAPPLPIPCPDKLGRYIFFYHAKTQAGIYKIKVALLSDELNVKKILPEAVLEPEQDYEKYGDVNNVIFLQGACYWVVSTTGREGIYVTYGGADKVVCAGFIGLNELLFGLR